MSTLKLKPILREAWKQVCGSKLSFLVVGLVMAIIELSITGVQAELSHGAEGLSLENIVALLVMTFASLPLITGYYMFGVRRARGESIRPKEGFIYYKKIIPLFFAQVLSAVTVWILMYGVAYVAFGLAVSSSELHKTLFVLIVTILVAIYVLISAALFALFQFMLILVVDQGQSPWQAYKNSIKMAFPNLKVLVIAGLLFWVLDMLALIPLGLGLIWTLPFSYITTGVFYREILKQQKLV